MAKMCGSSGPLLRIDHRKATLGQLDFGIFQTDAATDWTAPNADQHAIKTLVTVFAGTFEGDFDLIVNFGHRADFGVQINAFLKQRFEVLLQRFD